MYERFEKLLSQRGLKAADVANATGIGRSTFSDWKSGRSRPKSDKMNKIAEFLGTTADYLSGTDSDASRQGVIIGFGEEQKPINITEKEYETIKQILETMRNKS